MIKLGILRWRDQPELSGWVQGSHKGPRKREAGASESLKRM